MTVAQEEKLTRVYGFFALIIAISFHGKPNYFIWSILLITGGILLTRKFIRNKCDGKSNSKFYILFAFLIATVVMTIAM